jgi:TolB protein
LVSVLTRAAPDGSGTTELAREQSAVLSFLRSPTSDQIAYTTFNIVKGEFGPLVLVDGRSGERRVLSAAGEHAVALFWSPDGRELAYLTRDDDRDRSSKHTWHVVDTAGGAPRELARFTPSATFTRMLSFFDTYALSFSLWSPDATHLTYAAADGVYTLDLVSGTPTRIGAGDLALWVP